MITRSFPWRSVKTEGSRFMRCKLLLDTMTGMTMYCWTMLWRPIHSYLLLLVIWFYPCWTLRSQDLIRSIIQDTERLIIHLPLHFNLHRNTEQHYDTAEAFYIQYKKIKKNKQTYWQRLPTHSRNTNVSLFIHWKWSKTLINGMEKLQNEMLSKRKASIPLYTFG